jgi:hypothetical protein
MDVHHKNQHDPKSMRPVEFHLIPLMNDVGNAGNNLRDAQP